MEGHFSLLLVGGEYIGNREWEEKREIPHIQKVCVFYVKILKYAKYVLNLKRHIFNEVVIATGHASMRACNPACRRLPSPSVVDGSPLPRHPACCPP